MEHISHAAIIIRFAGCVIFGKDHDECVKKAVKKFRILKNYSQSDKGFLTSKLRFVSRQEAMEIAVTVGQISKSIRGRTLFSSHFFDKNLGGKHIYDSVLGYIIPVCLEKF